MKRADVRTRPRRGLRTRLTRGVLLAVAGLMTLTGCDFTVYSLPLPGGADLGDNPYEVTVAFRDVLDLVPQSAVKVDDVTVGSVDTIDVRGNHAEVVIKLRDTVKLPDNAIATLRQTSLLGEKFVSLAPPEQGASGSLGDGDTIPLERTGRNPEVEEVLSALSLLLNGGGVAQLKTIAVELNKALDGREANVKSVLSRLDEFMAQLDTGKEEIVRAIESLDRLAIAIKKQTPSITLALDELPRAIASIDSQRDDLVKMLKALADLSSVGTQVIRDSKAATIDSLQALAPTLTKLAETGDALPKALQVFLTYPFVDAVVGKNPAQARNLHMGDYTNLSAQLDLDLGLLLDNSPVDCDTIPNLPSELDDLCKTNFECVQKLLSGGSLADCKGVAAEICKRLPNLLGRDVCALVGVGTLPKLEVPQLSALEKCIKSGRPLGARCDAVRPKVLLSNCLNKRSQYYKSLTCERYRKLAQQPGNPISDLTDRLLGGSGPTGGTTGGSGGLSGLPGGVLRPGFGPTAGTSTATTAAPDSDLGALLVWGMVQR